MVENGASIPKYGELHERIYYPLIQYPQRFREGDVIREVCFLLVEGSQEITEKLANSNLHWVQTPEPMVKAVHFQTSKGVYLLASNFSKEPKSLTLMLPNEEQLSVDVPALSTQLKNLRHFSPKTGFEPQEKMLTILGRLKRAALFQNYPNPFNPETWIPYQLAEASEVTIRIYGTKGELIRTLALGQKSGRKLSDEKTSCALGWTERRRRIRGKRHLFLHIAGWKLDYNKDTHSAEISSGSTFLS